jgi:hypothetical protein
MRPRHEQSNKSAAANRRYAIEFVSHWFYKFLADSFAPLSRRYPARLCRLPRCFPTRGVLASCG